MIETIAVVLTGLSITASIIYYASILRNTNKARLREQIHLRVQSADLPYSKAWTNVMFKKATTNEEFQKIFNPINNPELFAEMIFIRQRYQSLGIMLKEGAVEPSLLYKIHPPHSIIVAWEHFKLNTFARRAEINDPTHMSEFEYLYNETKKRFPDIKRFIRYEQ